MGPDSLLKKVNKLVIVLILATVLENFLSLLLYRIQPADPRGFFWNNSVLLLFLTEALFSGLIIFIWIRDNTLAKIAFALIIIAIVLGINANYIVTRLTYSLS